MSLYGNSSQLYFDFVYSDYMKEHSEFKYLLDLIDMIDWSVVPDFSNKIGRTGYSRRALLKAIFVQKVKGFTVRELIHFLKSNPSFAKCIGFDPIINYVPSEATFSSFKKEFGPSYLDKVIVFTVLKGIKEGIFDTGYLVVDSYPIIFNSFFNNKKSHGKFKDYKEYYRSPLEANFGVKPVSNSKPIYDKYGNPKNAMSYLGYKAHTITFLNVPIFTVVSPASANDKNYAFILLEKVVKYLDLSGFNFLADAAYDSSDLYDYVHLIAGSIAFIPLRNSSKKRLVGECGKKLIKHSHYLESKRNIYRTKFVCDDPSNCPLGRSNCYSYRNYSKYDFRHFLNRESPFFKEIYKKRTLIESIFSRLESNNGTTSLKYTNAMQLECNLSNLFLIASALLAHKMGRDDLLSSPKTLMYETAS